jgi:4-amino-4-deoxy-L-arabinose transferase-like glycosyltransferase
MPLGKNNRSARPSFVSLLPLPDGGELPRALVFSAAVLAVYFFTRLLHLTIIPIFTDEAIYLRWAQIGLHDPQFRFISLTDGKQPLFVWLAMAAMKFISDPLVAGRLVSVGSGLISLTAVWLLTRELFGKKTGYFALVVYLLLPITLLYDRLALMESLLLGLGTTSVLLAVLLAKHLRLDLALLLGGVLGAALLTKSPGIFYFYLFPTSLIFLRGEEGRRRWRQFLVWMALAALVVLVAQFFVNLQRLSPWFYMIKEKNHNFVVTTRELRAAPWRWLPGNLRAFSHWIVGYLTPPVVLLVVLGAVGSLFTHRRAVLLLAGYFFIPLIASALFGKIIYARYLMFFIMPLLIMAGRGLEMTFFWLLRRGRVSVVSAGLLSLLLLAPAIRTDVFLVTNPPLAEIPDNDKNQYVDDWPAGYGSREVVAFLKEKAREGKVTVATEGTFGLMPYALELYLVDNPRVEILSYWPVDEIPPEVVSRARDHPTYFVFNQTQAVPQNFPLRLISRYRKGGSGKFLRLYRVIGAPDGDSVTT